MLHLNYLKELFDFDVSFDFEQSQLTVRYNNTCITLTGLWCNDNMDAIKLVYNQLTKEWSTEYVLKVMDLAKTYKLTIDGIHLKTTKLHRLKKQNYVEIVTNENQITNLTNIMTMP